MASFSWLSVPGVAVARLAIGRELAVIGTGSTAKREHAEAIGVRFVDYTAENVVTAARELVPATSSP